MTPSTRLCTVLIVDIAGSVALRAQLGEFEANRRIRTLLQAIVDIARGCQATFLKSYGDDVIATFESPADQGAGRAAEAAIGAQRSAELAGLQLYAGLCAGPVEFVESIGHPDAFGQAVNLAARLHKLVDDAPGRIFLPAELVGRLPAALRREASPFGARRIKGYGPMEVWSLAWRDHAATITFVPPKNIAGGATPGAELAPVLALWHRGRRIDVDPAAPGPFVLGRSPACSLPVSDPEPRISSKHLTLEAEAGAWMAHDVSRNGCWVRDARTGEEFPLLPGNKARLPARGMLCLGRSFTEDPIEIYTIRFEVLPRA